MLVTVSTRPLRAPRMAIHVISSTPWDPACSMISRLLKRVSATGSLTILSMHMRSNGLLMKPARAPSS